MPDRRRDPETRAAIARLELFRRLHPGGISFTEPFEGVRLGFVEQLVAALYTDGMTAKEIAGQVGCTPGTVDKHLEIIGRKVAHPAGDNRWDRITGWVKRRRTVTDALAMDPAAD